MDVMGPRKMVYPPRNARNFAAEARIFHYDPSQRRYSLGLQNIWTYRHESPATDERGQQLSTADVDVFRAEGHQIVGGADGVGRDVDTQGDNDQAHGCEGRSGTAARRAVLHPLVDDVDGIPHDLAIRRLRGGGREDTEQAHDGEDAGDDDGLDILRAGLVGVAGEIGNVEAEGGVVAQYAVEVREEGPSKDGTTDGRALRDDLAVVDGAAGPAQSIAKDSKEDNGSNETLEGEEVLHLGTVSCGVLWNDPCRKKN